MRKVISLVASLALVAGLLGAFAAPVSAASPTDFTSPCTDSSKFVQRVFSKTQADAGTTIEGARGKIHVSSSTDDGFTCEPSGGKTGNAYIWAADLQNGDGHNIIQWGICRLGSSGTWRLCANLIDYLGGASIQYITDSAAIPIVAGHDFYFQITGCTSPVGNWQWCLYVDDLDALSGDPTFRVGRSWDYNTGNLAWWGFELQDPGGVLGYRYGLDNKTYVYDMQYKRHDTNAWVYRQETNCEYGISAWSIPLTNFHCATDDTTYTNDTIRAYTTAY